MRYRLGRQAGSLAAALLIGAAGSTPAVVDRLAGPGPQRGARVVEAAAVAGLDQQLDTILADPRLAGAHAGVVVRNAVTGAIVYSRNGGKRSTPASNEKLLTSAAAADVLGLGHRFRTTVATTGTRSGAVLYGNLYLKGTGDPTIRAADYDQLAARVVAAGITSVRGGLVADDTYFDGVRLGTEWAWDDEQFAYAAQISALTVAVNDDFDTGAIGLSVGPNASAGQPARILLSPATDYIKVINRAVTGASGSARTISVERLHGTNTFVVSGSAPAGSAFVQNLRSVNEPTGYAASIFRAALLRRGVTISQAGFSVGATPSTAATLLTRDSAPLSQLLTPFLKLSNNGHAEILIKAMGRKVKNSGSWSAGLQAVSTFLTGAGVDAANLRMADGAGLSRQDLVSPEQLSALLRSVQGRSWFPTWYSALPIAGNPVRMVGGTLASRMQNTAAANNVRAKTGSLTSVSALSGYVTTAGGEKLTFSIMTKDFLGAAPKSLEDAIAVTLANYGGGATAAQLDLQRMPKRQVRDDPATSIDETGVECSWIKTC